MKYVAHVTIKTTAPLKIGSSEVDFIIDMPVLRDWNGLPFVPGTSIAGMLRALLDESEGKDIFGYEEKKSNEGMGSRVKFSSALLVDDEDRVHEELLLERNEFLQLFEELPIREHTAIDERGVVKDKSKFDEEVLYKGAKFRFSFECDEKEHFGTILDLLKSEWAMLGGKTTNGYGAFEIERIEWEEMDDMRYSEYVPSLNARLKETKDLSKAHQPTYELRLKPDMFFMFGSGLMDEDADHAYVTEPVIDYEKGALSEDKILIPATSVKGALYHRTLFYYNQAQGKYSDGEFDKELPELFGAKKGDAKEGKGKLYFSDCYLEQGEEKIFDHVKIDRFTGGAYEGALFQEKVVQVPEFSIKIRLKEKVDKKMIDAFEKALYDVANGMLPLGGGVMKGHGIFSGEVIKHGEKR